MSFSQSPGCDCQTAQLWQIINAECGTQVDALAEEHEQACQKAAERQAECVARSRSMTEQQAAMAQQQAVRQDLEARWARLARALPGLVSLP